MRWLFLALVIALYVVAYEYNSNIARLLGSLLTVIFIGHKWWTKGVKWKEQ